MSTYQEQLNDPRWKQRRLDILKRDGYTCKLCPNSGDENLLHVHHRYYLMNRMAWEYDDIVLITLCDECHNKEGEKLKHWAAIIVETLKQLGAMSDQLIEFETYLLGIGNMETFIQIMHDYEENLWRSTSAKRQNLFGSPTHLKVPL